LSYVGAIHLLSFCNKRVDYTKGTQHLQGNSQLKEPADTFDEISGLGVYQKSPESSSKSEMFGHSPMGFCLPFDILEAS